jgi:hypothetical protein
MGIIQGTILESLDQEKFGPEHISEQLSYLPEIFNFLKRIEADLETIRPVMTYIVAVTIWSFRQASPQEHNQIPPGFLDALWDRLSQGIGGRKLSEFLEQTEPNMWQYFLQVLQAAQEHEDWNEHDLAVASLVFGTVLATCILIFWPEESLISLEQDLSSLGFHDL